MLQKDQALLAADQLLAQETLALDNRRERRYRFFLYPLYRFRELAHLSRYEQAQLIRLASRRVDLNPFVLIPGLLLFASIAVLGFMPPPSFQWSPSYFVIGGALWVAVLGFVRHHLVHKAVIQLLAQRQHTHDTPQHPGG